MLPKSRTRSRPHKRGVGTSVLVMDVAVFSQCLRADSVAFSLTVRRARLLPNQIPPKLLPVANQTVTTGTGGTLLCTWPLRGLQVMFPTGNFWAWLSQGQQSLRTSLINRDARVSARTRELPPFPQEESPIRLRSAPAAVTEDPRLSGFSRHVCSPSPGGGTSTKQVLSTATSWLCPPWPFPGGVGRETALVYLPRPTETLDRLDEATPAAHDVITLLRDPLPTGCSGFSVAMWRGAQHGEEKPRSGAGQLPRGLPYGPGPGWAWPSRRRKVGVTAGVVWNRRAGHSPTVGRYRVDVIEIKWNAGEQVTAVTKTEVTQGQRRGKDGKRNGMFWSNVHGRGPFVLERTEENKVFLQDWGHKNTGNGRKETHRPGHHGCVWCPRGRTD